MKNKYLFFFIGVCFIGLTRVPLLLKSFSIDETVSAWIVSRPWSEFIFTCYQLNAQGVVYYVFANLFYNLGFDSEFYFRLPSLLFVGLAANSLYRYCLRNHGAQAGLIAICLFLLHFEVSHAASYFRSYSLALYAFMFSFDALDRYLKEKKLVHLFGVVLGSAVLIHAHYLFALSLLVHLSYLLVFHFGRLRKELKRLLICLVVFLLLLVPAYPQLSIMLSKKTALSYAEFPDLPSVIAMSFPFSIVLVSLIIALSAGGKSRFLIEKGVFKDKKVIFYLFWAVLPAFVLALLSSISEVSVFIARYGSWGSLGLSLFAATILSSLKTFK